MSGLEDHSHDHKEPATPPREGPSSEDHVHSHGSYAHSHDGHSHTHTEDFDEKHGLYEHVVEDEKGPAERYVTAGDAIDDLEESNEEVRYTGTSGLKVTVLEGLERLKNLKTMILRSCLVSDCSAIAANGATLEHLELYDNQLKSLRGVEACPKLRVLDVSFNVIRATNQVAICSELEECYIAANKLRSIDGFQRLEKLTKLDLGANRIRSIVGLPSNIKHLFLGKNRIERIDHLNHLTSLKVLDVQSNRLTSLENAFTSDVHANLQELYLAHNAIGPDLLPSHLAPLTSLSTLDLSHNRLTTLHAFAPLTALEDFWASYNQVPDLSAALPPIAHLPLTCIYLEHNPCYASDKAGYVNLLRETFPLLGQIDAVCYPPLGTNNNRR